MRKVYVNINFDDFHPQFYPDFGGDPNRGIFQLLRDLLNEFLGLKITLFTTPNWIDCPRRGPKVWYFFKHKLGIDVIHPYYNEPFNIKRHPIWCDVVRSLVKEGRFEIAVHGYHHCNPRLYAHNQEFSGLNELESYERIIKAEKLFKECGIPFVKGFRPPGWGLSGGLIQALKKLNYLFFAPFSSHLRLSRIGILEGMAIPPSNYSCAENPIIVNELARKYGVVFIKGHLAYKYGWEKIENGITSKTQHNIREALKQLTDNFDVQYVTILEYIKNSIDREILIAKGIR